MDLKLEEVSLERVDFDDRRFDLSGGRPPRELVASVRRVGLASAPVLSAQDARGRHTIVIGWRRLLACREAGLREAKCLVAAAEAQPPDLLRMAIEDLRASGGMGKLAQGRALRAWEGIRPEGQGESEFLSLLGLPPKRGLLDSIRRWARIAPDVEAACDAGLVAESAALALAAHPAEAREAFVRLFADLRFGVNLQKEALEMISETARREGAAPAEAIERVRGEALAEAGSAEDLPRLAEAFRRALRRRRFPRVSAAEERFGAIVRDLRLAPGCSIEAPPFFEGREYRFVCRFGSVEELARALRQAADKIGGAEALRDFIHRGE